LDATEFHIVVSPKADREPSGFFGVIGSISGIWNVKRLAHDKFGARNHKGGLKMKGKMTIKGSREKSTLPALGFNPAWSIENGQRRTGAGAIPPKKGGSYKRHDRHRNRYSAYE
jgi:hypothetical protein